HRDADRVAGFKLDRVRHVDYADEEGAELRKGPPLQAQLRPFGLQAQITVVEDLDGAVPADRDGGRSGGDAVNGARDGVAARSVVVESRLVAAGGSGSGPAEAGFDGALDVARADRVLARVHRIGCARHAEDLADGELDGRAVVARLKRDLGAAGQDLARATQRDRNDVALADLALEADLAARGEGRVLDVHARAGDAVDAGAARGNLGAADPLQLELERGARARSGVLAAVAGLDHRERQQHERNRRPVAPRAPGRPSLVHDGLSPLRGSPLEPVRHAQVRVDAGDV